MTNDTILVVGGAGYIGTHMVKDLLQEGFQVVVLDDLSTGHHDLLPGGDFIQGQIGDRAVLDRIFTHFSISAVMHFAACSLVGESVENPIKYYRNNVSHTTELLAAMRRHQVQHFIFSSTAAVYGNPKIQPIPEDAVLKPTNPYGTTKVAIEDLSRYCDDAFGIKSISLRYFNAAGADPSGTIGERHRPETHLIPIVLQTALKEREHLNIFGTNYPTRDGTCVRDYIHVTDLTRAHLLALTVLMNGGDSAVYNLGNSRGYSVRDVIDVSQKISRRKIPFIETDRRPGDPPELVADSTNAREKLGWQPQYEDLEAIIETAWTWHRNEAKKNECICKG